jgi:hypothetical protein
MAINNEKTLLIVSAIEFIIIFIAISQWNYRLEKSIKEKPQTLDKSYSDDIAQIDEKLKVDSYSTITIDEYIGYMISYPFKIIWNILLLALTLWAFIAWWGLIFGSIVAIVLILIFSAYDILFLPIAILGFIAPLTPDSATESETATIHILGVITIGITLYMLYNSLI